MYSKNSCSLFSVYRFLFVQSVQSGRGARDALGPYRSQNLTDEVIVSDVVSLLDVVLQFAFEDSQVEESL